MVPKGWVAASGEMLSSPLVEALVGRVSPPHTVLQSESGLRAVVVPLEPLRSRSDIDLSLDLPVTPSMRVALVLTAPALGKGLEEISALHGVSDLVAVPIPDASQGPLALVWVGELTQRIDPALPEQFAIGAWRAPSAEFLTRGAPVGPDEEPDDLAGRADWFKKRH